MYLPVGCGVVIALCRQGHVYHESAVVYVHSVGWWSGIIYVGPWSSPKITGLVCLDIALGDGVNCIGMFPLINLISCAFYTRISCMTACNCSGRCGSTMGVYSNGSACRVSVSSLNVSWMWKMFCQFSAGSQLVLSHVLKRVYRRKRHCGQQSWRCV